MRRCIANVGATEKDILGADLDEPLQDHTMPATITIVAPRSQLF